MFNVVMASLMDGAQSQDCQDLLVLCMYLKMIDGNCEYQSCLNRSVILLSIICCLLTL